MGGLDSAERPRPGAHDDGVRLDAPLDDPDAAEQRAAGAAGRGDEEIAAPHEVVGGQHAVDLVADVQERLALLGVARPELALHRPAKALDRRWGDDALGRPAD